MYLEIFVQDAGYLGDLMLLHDVATSSWSCSFRLVGALEIFLVFLFRQKNSRGEGAIALTSQGNQGNTK